MRFLKGAAHPLAPWTEALGPSDATVLLKTETVSLLDNTDMTIVGVKMTLIKWNSLPRVTALM